jgi:hypothetical protein
MWEDQYEAIRADVPEEQDHRRFRTWIYQMGLEHHPDGFIFIVTNPHRYMLACIKYGLQRTYTP